ncbi:MAG: TetR/AcrR family transcriptional regulator [Actinobacteria bacterium]|nr:TetR/AcrR family transcriptional regulator [Actinomycetota bacterium]
MLGPATTTPPKTTTTTTAKAVEPKREAILDSALQLMSERTFHGCPVPLIAEHAGVATGTIYRYFDSKETLANAVYQRWKGELARRLLDGMADREATPVHARELFHLWWTSLTQFVTEHPRAFTFLELHHHEPYLDETSQSLALQIDVAAVQTIEQGQRDGAIRPGNPALLVALAYGAFSGLGRAKHAFGDLFEDSAFAEAEDAVWDLLAAPTTD